MRPGFGTGSARQPAPISLLLVLLFTCLPDLSNPVRAADNRPVDVALVLAVDASVSVGRMEFGLQMDGIAHALRDANVRRAIRSGPNGAVAVTLVEWSSPVQRWQALPWTRLETDAEIEAFADEVQNTPRIFATGGTAIGAALHFAADLLDRVPFPARRRVIDLSGDGSNSDPPAVAGVRADILSRGITINGLPVLSEEPEMDRYYAETVIGGPGSFIEIATDFDAFAVAMTRKLIRELQSAPLLSRND